MSVLFLLLISIVCYLCSAESWVESGECFYYTNLEQSSKYRYSLDVANNNFLSVTFVGFKNQNIMSGRYNHFSATITTLSESDEISVMVCNEYLTTTVIYDSELQIFSQDITVHRIVDWFFNHAVISTIAIIILMTIALFITISCATVVIRRIYVSPIIITHKDVKYTKQDIEMTEI